MSALAESPFFGIALTVAAYWVGTKLQKKTGLVVCNNIIIAVALLIAVLSVFRIPYDAYYQGGSIINMLLGPATACMAVTIYAKLELLKKNWLPVLLGCLAGTVTSIGSILVLCRLFGLDAAMTASLLPKSVTTPIASAVSESHGGIVSVTVAAVIFTGILGNLLAPFLVKLLRVKDPLSAGLGIGACSHAIGTAKALEMGETEGAMSGLAIGVCGIITAVLAWGFEWIV
ncbi:MAG: LrgB family protein [Oscillospiraceae bacterium]|nr:LrgB family protein [Oscillospiraceae bacterium]